MAFKEQFKLITTAGVDTDAKYYSAIRMDDFLQHTTLAGGWPPGEPLVEEQMAREQWATLLA